MVALRNEFFAEWFFAECDFCGILLPNDLHSEDGPYIDVTDFTFSESEGAKVPFAYAADCIMKPAVTTCSLYGTNLRFQKSAKTFIGYFGHMVRNSFFCQP